MTKTLETARAAASAMPDSVVKAALREAKEKAAEAYRLAPRDGEPEQFKLPSDAKLIAVLAGPFAVNAERFVTKCLGKSMADLTLAGQTAVTRLVQVYNETEQTLAARHAGVE